MELAARSDVQPSALRRFLGLQLLDNRYPALHGVRVLAIVAVVQFHVTSIFVHEHGLPMNLRAATMSLTVFFGMDLFFLLSGFLIGAILLHSIEVAGTQQVRRFYLRRIFRTFPSYWLVLTALVLLGPLTKQQLANVGYEYVYLTNYLFPIRCGDVAECIGRHGYWGAFSDYFLNRKTSVMIWGWSLALEEQFYLAVPVLVFLLQKLRGARARIAMLVGLFFLALGVRLAALYRPDVKWDDGLLFQELYVQTHARFDPLVAGILLAYLERHHKATLDAWLSRGAVRVVLTVLSLACLALLLFPRTFGEERFLLVRVFSWGTLTSVMYGAWILLLLHGPSRAAGWLSRPWFRSIATLGYGVYLVHMPVADRVLVPMAKALVARGVAMAWIWPAALVALLGLSLAVSYALHLLIEKPALAIRDRLAA